MTIAGRDPWLESLTHRQYEVLCFVHDFHEQHQYAPSYREIGDAVGLDSPSSVQAQVETLVASGHLSSGKGPRTLATCPCIWLGAPCDRHAADTEDAR